MVRLFTPMSLDHILFYKINHLPHNGFLNGLATLVSYSTYWGAAFMVLCLFNYAMPSMERKLLAKAGALAMLVAGLFNDGVFHFFIHRARPFVVLSEVVTVGYTPSSYSFPSGHTALAFAMAAAYCMVFPHRLESYIVVCAALLVGFSRIYMGVHYPSDVLAGMVLGSFCGVVCTMFVRRYLP